MTMIEAEDAAGEGVRDEPPGAGQLTGGLKDSPSARIGTTRSLVAAYVRLCHDPIADLRSWIDEDERPPAQARHQASATTGRNHDRHDAERIHHQPLPSLRGGMDQNQQQRRDDDRVPARSAAHVEGDDRLQSLRADADSLALAVGDEGEAVSLEAELSALRSIFGARIEAVRRTTPQRDRAASVKALKNEKKAAILEITERRRRERVARHQADLARRPARDPGLPR